MSGPRAVGAWLVLAFSVAACGVGVPDPGSREDAATPPQSAPDAASDSLPVVTVSDVVLGLVDAGLMVRVRGTCIGYSTVRAVGPQPRTRSDWQLQDSLAVWVVGAYPDGCAGSTPSAAPVTVYARVEVDTLQQLGASSPRPRYYLVRGPQ